MKTQSTESFSIKVNTDYFYIGIIDSEEICVFLAQPEIDKYTKQFITVTLINKEQEEKFSLGKTVIRKRLKTNWHTPNDPLKTFLETHKEEIYQHLIMHKM